MSRPSDRTPDFSPAPVPVALVTGFLGSGKTTLINAVLRAQGFAGTLVVVNEFGDVGLDHLLVANAQDQVVLLDSGCLCCAASGSLRDTLIDVFARRASGQVPAFERIIVETSGLAHPGPLVASLIGDSALTPRCALAQVLTLVDAHAGADTLERYAEARHQVAFADRLALTKVDTAEPAQTEALRQRLHDMNPEAPLHPWHRGLPAEPLFVMQAGGAGTLLQRPAAWLDNLVRARPRAAGAGLRMRPHDAGFERIGSFVFDTGPDPIDWPTYARWTQALTARFGRRLLRCKGLLPLGEGDRPWVVQGVQGYFAAPQRLPAWPEAGRRGFLVCIGDGIARADLQAVLGPPASLLSTQPDPS